MTDMTTWISTYAHRLGLEAPDQPTVDAILRLAAVAAHGSARQAAPVACWLTAAAGLGLAEAEALATEISTQLEHG